MVEDLRKARERLAKEMAGLSPVEKQIILLKLTNLYENRPANFGQYQIAAGSPEREWISAAGALVTKYDPVHFGSTFKTKVAFLNSGDSANEIVGIVSDVIEVIKLELELDGRSEIGTVYQPGEVYQFYADLKDIIAAATTSIFLIDPYLNGSAFNEYLGPVREVDMRLLVGKTAQEVKNYADRHSQQYQTSIEVRKSKEIHDRLIVVDNDESWVIGGSLNMKGDKPTYLLLLTPGVSESARTLYTNVWDRAAPFTA